MKKSNFNIFYFLLSFTILYYGFVVYIGLITPGGKTYSSFLYNYLNVPQWLSIFIAKASALVLKIAGYDVYQKYASNVTIRESRGVTIAWACIGAGVLSVWISFVIAHKAKLAYKLKWMISGVALIFVFNILRIVTIALSNYYDWTYLKSFDAHSTFNIITYILIIILMIIFVLKYNKFQQKNTA